MDLDVRWFRREVALAVARRLAIETCVAVVATAALLAATLDPSTAVIGALLAVPTFLLLRICSSLAVNPMSSAYLVRWPRPAGELPPDNDEHASCSSDIELTAAGFVSLGTFTEWGGSLLSVYTNRQDTLALSSGDQLVLLSGLDDDRLCISTTQLVPPHDQIIVNHHPTADDATLVAKHAELAGELVASSIGPIGPEIELVRRFLTLEWEIWHDIGPLLGPFVRVGSKRQPSLILARVSSADILDRGRVRTEQHRPRTLVDDHDASPAEAVWPVVALDPIPDPIEPTRRPQTDAPSRNPESEPDSTSAEDDLATTLIDILEREPTSAAPTPPQAPRDVQPAAARGLSGLAEQAARAANCTDRALAAGDARSTTDVERRGER